jgi:D-cysteine desulfhydrase
VAKGGSKGGSRRGSKGGSAGSRQAADGGRGPGRPGPKRRSPRGGKRAPARAAGRASSATLSRRGFLAAGLGATGTLVLAGSGAHYVAARFNTIGSYDPERLAALRDGASTLLLERHPRLAASLPWRPLARPGTPVEPLPSLPGAADVRLYVKRDDLTSALYGGNKVRKLEHFLAEAELAGRRTLVTMGGAGTHHGLATVLHGRSIGLATQVSLFDQPMTPRVERNVRGMLAADAEIRFSRGELRAAWAARELYASAEAQRRAPYFIMAGGSARLGSAGYVNAALELAEQVRSGDMPEPDRIFVALGSCGTAAGLAVGCRLAGLRARVTAVRVTPAIIANSVTLAYHASDLAAWLHRHDPTVPRIRIWPGDVDVIGSQYGGGYGRGTEAGAAAAEWAGPRLGLEPTYTAKALAACLAHCRESARPGEVVLYWHTANGAAFPLAESLDGAPAALRQRLEAIS